MKRKTTNSERKSLKTALDSLQQGLEALAERILGSYANMEVRLTRSARYMVPHGFLYLDPIEHYSSLGFGIQELMDIAALVKSAGKEGFDQVWAGVSFLKKNLSDRSPLCPCLFLFVERW